MKKLHLRIFHFSDIHYSTGILEHELRIQDEVNGYINSIIENMNSFKSYSTNDSSLLKFIFLSGDLTFKGAKEQFQFIKNNFVTKLNEIIKPDFTFISPGNHDLEREVYKKDITLSDSVSTALGSNRDKKEYSHILNEMIHNNYHLDHIKRAFENFCTFKQENEKVSLNSKEKILSPFYWFQKISIPGNDDFEINILNFNTAWQYSNEFDYYGILFSDHVSEASSFVNEGAPHKFNISVFHHPNTSLDPFSQDNMQMVSGFSNIILNGHVHRWEATSIVSSYSSTNSKLAGKTLQLSSRCVADEHENYNFTPGFSVVNIDVDMDQFDYEMDIIRYTVPQRLELNNGRTFEVDRNYNPLTVKCKYGGVTITDMHNEFEMRELEILKRTKEKVYFLTDRIRPYDKEHALLIDTIKSEIERGKEIYYYTSITSIEDLLGAVKRFAIGCNIFDSLDLVQYLSGNRVVIGDDNILLKGKIALTKKGETRITSFVEDDKLCTLGYLNMLQSIKSDDIIPLLKDKIKKYGQNVFYEDGIFVSEGLIEAASIDTASEKEISRLNSIIAKIGIKG